MKKAILVVSFGTSYIDNCNKTIGAIEEDIDKYFSDYKVFRAFTSSIIINKLKKAGVNILDVSEALSLIKAEEFEEVIIQPTHIIAGHEYDKMLAMAQSFKDEFKRFVIGQPLLYSNEDYINIARFIEDEIINKDGSVLLMGHGSEHKSNEAYTKLQGYINNKNIHIATVEGKPTLDDVINKLSNNILLTPFMIVAGDHANNDMAGDKDSWKSTLTSSGFSVSTLLKGLGEYKSVRYMFIEHIRRVI